MWKAHSISHSTEVSLSLTEVSSTVIIFNPVAFNQEGFSIVFLLLLIRTTFDEFICITVEQTH